MERNSVAQSVNFLKKKSLLSRFVKILMLPRRQKFALVIDFLESFGCVSSDSNALIVFCHEWNIIF